MLRATKVHYAVGTKEILRNVSMEVHPGEMVALCGPNGAGKSTLLRILSSEQNATEGDVEFGGKKLSEWSPGELARTRAKLSQESQLTFSFRVIEVVEMGRFPHDTPAVNDAIVQACMERVGIADLAHREYTSLSGGEKQRVHLARVMAQLTSDSEQPRLLLLDEPTSALDLLHQEIALELAHTLCREQSFGVIVVLHDLNLAASWSDRVVMMKGGEVKYSGLPAEVLNPEVLRDVYGIDVLVLEHPKTGRPIITIDRSNQTS